MTFLSKSPGSSRRAQSLLASLFDAHPASDSAYTCASKSKHAAVTDNDNPFQCQFDGDELDRVLRPFVRNGFHSTASVDSSGAIFHFLSLRPNGGNNDHDNSDNHESSPLPLSILAITTASNRDTEAAVTQARQLLARRIQQGPSHLSGNIDIDTVVNDSEINIHVDNERSNSHGHFQSGLTGLKVMAQHLLGRSITPGLLLSISHDLPFLQLDGIDDGKGEGKENETDSIPKLSTIMPTKTRLREIVLPYSYDDEYCNGRNFMDVLSNSSLSRPITGLYQLASSASSSLYVSDEQYYDDGHDGGVYIRPLPTAANDMISSPPTLVFQCESIQHAQSTIAQASSLLSTTTSTTETPMVNSKTNQPSHSQASMLQINRVGSNSNSPGQLLLHHPHWTCDTVSNKQSHRLQNYCDKEETVNMK